MLFPERHVRELEVIQRIIVCEPQCAAFVHVPFNSALLATVLAAYPESSVAFFGEQEHMARVGEHLKAHGVPARDRVSWEPIEVPVRGGNGFRILGREWKWCRRILREAKDPAVDAVVLCSVTNTGLLFLKPLLFLTRFQKPVVAFLHGILDSLDRPAPWKPWYWALHLKRVMLLPHPRTLRYIALSESILGTLRAKRPELAKHFSVLDIPGLWRRNIVLPPPSSSPLRFGFVGTTAAVKRFDWFCRLAFEVRQEAAEAEFVLAGFATQGGESAGHCDAVQGVGTVPLDAREFAERASSLTYTVWTGDPEYYRLVASASFLDSLYYGKPGIYLRNPYIEHYFERMGDIGYLADSYEEMRYLILHICREFPEERYRRQCANILREREALSPASLGAKFRGIVDSLLR